ncbi:hypothetical protein C8R45DRAFT_919373 [Mycena sanguinolenta]|nr:hypothetical protein C8R45DRAFT_919373 [Mycena sanguinolenta]
MGSSRRSCSEVKEVGGKPGKAPRWLVGSRLAMFRAWVLDKDKEEEGRKKDADVGGGEPRGGTAMGYLQSRIGVAAFGLPREIHSGLFPTGTFVIGICCVVENLQAPIANPDGFGSPTWAGTGFKPGLAETRTRSTGIYAALNLIRHICDIRLSLSGAWALSAETWRRGTACGNAAFCSDTDMIALTDAMSARLPGWPPTRARCSAAHDHRIQDTNIVRSATDHFRDDECDLRPQDTDDLQVAGENTLQCLVRPTPARNRWGAPSTLSR